MLFTRNEKGETFLYHALRDGVTTAVMRMYIEVGGKELLLVQDKKDETVLHGACREGISDIIINMILSAGGQALASTGSSNCVSSWVTLALPSKEC